MCDWWNKLLIICSNGIARQPSLDGDSAKQTLGNLRKSWKKRKEVKDKRDSPTEDRAPSPAPRDERSRPGWDFVADDFEGILYLLYVIMTYHRVIYNSHL